MSRVHISESRRCFTVKPSTYYFHMKTKILADFQICISVTLKDCRICYFLNFCYFYLSKFQLTIMKNPMEKPAFVIMDFEGFRFRGF